MRRGSGATASVTLRLPLRPNLKRIVYHSGRIGPECAVVQPFLPTGVDQGRRLIVGRRETVVAITFRRTPRQARRVMLAALILGWVGPVQPASAEGLFQALFGSFRRHAPEIFPSQSTSFADPLAPSDHQRSTDEAGGFGHGTVYCVRTCDGRYFPLPHHSGSSAVALCKAFCPATRTMVFSGSRIDTAVAPNGTRYADLDQAFAYRDKVTDSCSCNGKDGLGLARVEVSGDPTLRSGDIVATSSGLATFNGKSGATEFTPISTSSGEWARRLSEVKIEPAPLGERIEPVAEDSTRPARKGRAQASR